MKVLLAEHHRYDSPLRVGSHHVARVLLGRGHEVVWLAHPRSWLHRLKGPLAPLERRHADGVLEVTLRAPLPYVRMPGLDSVLWGRRWLRSTPACRRRLARLGAGGCDLFWVSDFTQLGLIDALGDARVVLRFFDHLDAFRWMPRSIYRLARRYRHRADVLIASSRSIQARLAEEGLDALYVPNGAHLRPGLRERAVAAEREPLIVYLGAVAEWFDLAAVELWADRLPEAEFRIVGPNPARHTSSRANVRFTGPLAYDRVPELLLRARAGIIPFLRNPLTEGVHPLKLYDYLGAGCPVVAAALPEIRPVPGAVFTYEDPEEAVAPLRRCLEDPFDRARLHELAVANSWVSRLAGVLAVVEDAGDAAAGREGAAV